MTQDFIIDNQHYHVKIDGEGFPLLLLHGYIESSSVFDHLIPELSKYFKIIRPDIPGHGRSGNVVKTWLFEDFASHLNYIMDQLEIEKFIFAGHSMGGYIGQAFAKLFPRKLKSLWLVHSALWDAHPKYIAKKDKEYKLIKSGKKQLLLNSSIAGGFAPHNREKLKLQIEDIKRDALELSDECLFHIIEAMKQRKSSVEEINSHNIPVVVIAGKHDETAPADKLKEEVQKWNNAKYILLSNSGHHCFIEEQKIFSNLIMCHNKIK